MSLTLNDTKDCAKNAMDAAKESAEHAASNAKSTLYGATKTLVDVASLLRSVGVHDALAWMGLARRRSLFGASVIFGGGVVVGAGLGVLLAPMSGEQLRCALRRRFAEKAEEVTHKAGDTLEKAAVEVKQAGCEAGDTLEKAGADVKQAGQKAVKNAENEELKSQKAQSGSGSRHLS